MTECGKISVEADRHQMSIWRMRIACWICKATNTHSEYVILPTFPLQQWLHERASILAMLKRSGNHPDMFKDKIQGLHQSDVILVCYVIRT